MRSGGIGVEIIETMLATNKDNNIVSIAIFPVSPTRRWWAARWDPDAMRSEIAATIEICQKQIFALKDISAVGEYV